MNKFYVVPFPPARPLTHEGQGSSREVGDPPPVATRSSGHRRRTVILATRQDQRTRPRKEPQEATPAAPHEGCVGAEMIRLIAERATKIRGVRGPEIVPATFAVRMTPPVSSLVLSASYASSRSRVTP